MKRMVLALCVMSLLLMIPALPAQEKPDVKMMKEKITQEVARMKAAGASDEEINKFIAESKKKIEQMKANNGGNGLDDKALKEKLDRKVADMRAAGASDEEIKKAVLEFKSKVEQMKAGNGGNSLDEKAFKEKLDQKVAQMKAAGASDEEINRMVKEAKQRWGEQNSKTQKPDKY